MNRSDWRILATDEYVYICNQWQPWRDGECAKYHLPLGKVHSGPAWPYSHKPKHWYTPWRRTFEEALLLAQTWLTNMHRATTAAESATKDAAEVERLLRDL